MKRSALTALALGVGGAAVGGYGAAIGRDAWKETKRNGLVLIILALAAGAAFLPYWGARMIFRGHPEGATFIAIPFGAVLVAVGWVAATLLLGWAFQGDRQAMLWVFGLAGASTAAGIWIGLGEREKRFRIHRVANQNEAFLDRFGIVETGESEITHHDRDGNALRVLERTNETIVFMGVGSRNQRAYIKLSDEGEMLGYTGLIELGHPRHYFS